MNLSVLRYFRVWKMIPALDDGERRAGKTPIKVIDRSATAADRFEHLCQYRLFSNRNRRELLKNRSCAQAFQASVAPGASHERGSLRARSHPLVRLNLGPDRIELDHSTTRAFPSIAADRSIAPPHTYCGSCIAARDCRQSPGPRRRTARRGGIPGSLVPCSDRLCPRRHIVHHREPRLLA